MIPTVTSSPSTPSRSTAWPGIIACMLAVTAITVAFPARPTPAATGGAAIDEAAKRKLDESFELCVSEPKGPFTLNYCVCPNGDRQPVQLPDGTLQTPCGGNVSFCAAWRTEPAEVLATERVYIANLFARDLFLWDDFPDHHDLVRGYILEKFFVDTHPDHTFAKMRAYGGLAGAEFEARDSILMFERYIDSKEFDEPRHYLLAYELQRRFYVRNDQGQIHKVRNLASAIHRKKRDFKPLRDAVHNQISPAQIPRLEAYRDKLPPGELKGLVQELITELEKLTSLDRSVLDAQLLEIEGRDARSALTDAMPEPDDDTVEAVTAMADVMVLARRRVETHEGSTADRRRLIDAAITAAAIIQRQVTALIEAGTELTAKQHVELLLALTDAAFGSGLLTERERAALAANLDAILDSASIDSAMLTARLQIAKRAVEWAQGGVQYAFAEVHPAWTYVLPDTHLIGDDVLRGSPLLLYARVLEKLETFAMGREPIAHDVFGQAFTRGVRALNPGLAFGRLRVSPRHGEYARTDIVALADTPPDLEPAAGIFTQGEGNVVSHVQLLARALGIPNVVLAPAAFEKFATHDGQEVMFIATTSGRVIVKQAGEMTEDDRVALAEFTRNHARSTDGAFGSAGGRKLHIDVDSLDLSIKTAIDLGALRRVDSGIRVGPKAAFLGELRHLFPDKVSRGVVAPFGAYHDHYSNAVVSIPAGLRGSGIAEAGTPLPAFVKQTYATFFDEMIPAGTSETELSAWIRPRLDIIRESIRAAPISTALRKSVITELSNQGLLDEDGTTLRVGLFVRSDTNVEDLDDFNGAGLNLTIFNLATLDDVFKGLKEVWASPFTSRSFSWRQTLIDTPEWVLPSVVILESVPSQKSGVLVTADINGNAGEAGPEKMLIATSEGVGGAVDGTPTETLIWSPDGVELVTLFKSPWRRLLRSDGGSEIVASTGSERVLSDAEVDELVSTARIIKKKLAPSLDGSGNARPWDIEYGFVDGKLWLFQVRPFIGNDEVDNLPALAAYEAEAAREPQNLSLADIIQ